jgi:hypothetical protein
MPTRLDVLLQSRKSAAAGPAHRHIAANASTDSKPARARRDNGMERWESSVIIQSSTINSWMISRDPPGAVNGHGTELTPVYPVCTAIWQNL